MILPLIEDEDHRVRSAVANCLVRLVATWTTQETSADVVRVQRLTSSCSMNAVHWYGASTFAGVRLSMNGLARPYHHIVPDDCLGSNLKMLVDVLFNLLVTSQSKFTKVIYHLLSSLKFSSNEEIFMIQKPAKDIHQMQTIPIKP